MFSDELSGDERTYRTGDYCARRGAPRRALRAWLHNASDLSDLSWPASPSGTTGTMKMGRLKIARSRFPPWSCSLLRIAQTCLGRSGGFAPMSFPLFQGTCTRVAFTAISDMANLRSCGGPPACLVPSTIGPTSPSGPQRPTSDKRRESQDLSLTRSGRSRLGEDRGSHARIRHVIPRGGQSVRSNWVTPSCARPASPM